MAKQAFYTAPVTGRQPSGAPTESGTRALKRKASKKKLPAKQGMSRYAFFIGLGLTALGVLISAAEPLKFLNLTGLIIVVGGIAAAVFASYPLKEVRKAWEQARETRQEYPNMDHKHIEQLFLFTVLLRRNNLHGAEQVMETLDQELMKTGMQGLLDREPAAEIGHLMSWRINQFRQERTTAIKIFQSMAVYAPAFGMVGTLVGLVNMMLVIEQKSFDLVSANLGIALVTTFYGLLLANLLFKPFAIKLERQMDAQLATQRLIYKGIQLIAEGKSPALLRDQLLSLCTEPNMSHSTTGVTSAEAQSAIEQVFKPAKPARSGFGSRPVFRSAS